MRGSIIIALKKIKKRKLQSFLIGIIIASSALLFSTALGIMISMKNPINKMFADSKSSHDLMVFNSSSYDKNKIQSWWNSQKEVDYTQIYNTLTLNSNIMINGKKINNQYNLLTEMPQNKGDIDNFKIVKGINEKTPGNGEVWINTGLADTYKVKPGNMISINNKNYKISAVIVDTETSSLMIGTERYWVKEGELKNYSQYNKSPEYSIAIRYKNPENSENKWDDFQKYLNGPFVGSRLQYNVVYQCYSTVLKYTGVFMLFFSVIIIITAMCIIKFVISNSIYKDYKNIGIFKAVGFEHYLINLIYVMQYLIISFISVICGIILSKFAIDKMMESTLKIIGLESYRMSYAIPFISTFFVMMILIILSVFFSTLKTNKIKPVEALKENVLDRHATRRKSNGNSIFMKYSVPKSMGFRSILNNRMSALLIFLSIFITLFASLSGVNLLYTTTSMGRNMGYWGFDNSMVDIKFNSNVNNFIEKFIDDMRVNKNVECFSNFAFYQNVSCINIKGNVEKIIVAQVLGNGSDKLGFMEMQGRNPEKINEMALSINSAKINKKHIGDYMEVYIKNKKYDLLIVGIYQSLNGMGKGIRLYNDTVQSADREYVPEILVDLKNPNNINSFMKDMRNKYNDKITISKSQDRFTEDMAQMTGGSFAAVGMIIVIMLSISLINIFNITMMNINEERKSYGIYKAIGLTSKQIRSSIIFKTTLVFTAALLVSIPLVIKVTPVLMSLIFINVGIAKYPVSVSVPGMMVIAVICYIFSILSAYIASCVINKIDLRSLIEE